jgi:hypothetical protein
MARGKRIRGSCDRQRYRLANKVTYVCGAPEVFGQLALTLKSGDTGQTLNFGHAWSKARKGYPRELFGNVEAAAERVQVVCDVACGTSIDPATIQRLFHQLRLDLHFPLSSSPALFPGDERESLEGREH